MQETQETRVPSLGQEDSLEKVRLPTPLFLGFPGDSVGKELTYNEGNLGSIPGLGAWQPNSSILAWEISWTEEPGRV